MHAASWVTMLLCRDNNWLLATPAHPYNYRRNSPSVSCSLTHLTVLLLLRPTPCMQVITGSVSQLEQLLPQVAYGNIMAESPAALTPTHHRQLLLLGQACLDYLHAICQATSRALVSCAGLLLA